MLTTRRLAGCLIFFQNFTKEVSTILELFITIAGAGAAGGIVGYFVRKNVAESKIATAEETAIRIIQDAEQAGETKRKEALMEAKEEIHRMRSEMERENKERRSDLQRQERRLLQKKKTLTEN